MSIRLFTTTERLSLLANDVSTSMPSEIGPVVAGILRLRIAGGLVSSAHTDGAGCDLRGVATVGVLMEAFVAGGVTLGTGRDTAGGGAAEAVNVLEDAVGCRVLAAETR